MCLRVALTNGYDSDYTPPSDVRRLRLTDSAAAPFWRAKPSSEPAGRPTHLGGAVGAQGAGRNGRLAAEARQLLLGKLHDAARRVARRRNRNGPRVRAWSPVHRSQFARWTRVCRLCFSPRKTIVRVSAPSKELADARSFRQLRWSFEPGRSDQDRAPLSSCLAFFMMGSKQQQTVPPQHNLVYKNSWQTPMLSSVHSGGHMNPPLSSSLAFFMMGSKIRVSGRLRWCSR